jgi:hypothetical protein
MQRRAAIAFAVTGLAAACLSNAWQNPTRGHELPKGWQKMNCSQRIDTLQDGFQKAMNDLSRTKTIETTSVVDGKTVKVKLPATFGLRRLATVMITHNGVPRDTDVPVMFQQTDGFVEYLGVSCKGAPLSASGLTLHEDFGNARMGTAPVTHEAYLAFARKALPELSKTTSYVGKIEGNRAEARAIKLSSPECLSCHRNMKVGDNAAIIVYITRPLPTQTK